MEQRKREKGQVLLLGLIAVIILLVSVFLLFDVHRTILSKIRSQNAVDAAALVGARWQMHTLNTLGELNLIKASSVLLSEEIFVPQKGYEDFLKVTQKEDFDEIDLNQRYGILKAATSGLSQMQYRILFMGPLIGAGAAQQAGFNNGLKDNASYGNAVSTQLKALEGTDVIPDYLYEAYGTQIPKNISWAGVYERYKEADFIKKRLYGFKWYVPYLSFISSLVSQNEDGVCGICVMPSGDIIGSPHIESDADPDFTSFFLSSSFYEATDLEYWCWLIDFIDLRKKAPSVKWWGNLKAVLDDSFTSESEFLPVKVEIKQPQPSDYDMTLVQSGYYDEAVKQAEKKLSVLKGKTSKIQDWEDPYKKDSKGNIIENTEDSDMYLSPLPVIDFAYYKSNWSGYKDQFVTYWRKYLVSDFKEEALYKSGAVSRMDARSYANMLLGIGENEDGTRSTLVKGLDKSGRIFNTSGTVRTAMDRHNARFGSMSKYAVSIRVNSLAKPFGYLEINNKRIPPHLSRIVLPVFEKTSLIPVALEDPGANSLENYDWSLFLLHYLPALGMVNYVNDVPEPIQKAFSYYHKLIAKADSEAFVEKGWLWLYEKHEQRTPIYDENHNIIDYKVTYTQNIDSCFVNEGSGSGGGSGGGSMTSRTPPPANPIPLH